MLTGLRLGNFKAFGETQHIPIKPLTLIFGANSAGKSSIIQGLLLARHAHETGNIDVYQTRIGGEAVNLGGFRQYVHRRDSKRQVTWGATLDLATVSYDSLDKVLEYATHSNTFKRVNSSEYTDFDMALHSLGVLQFDLNIGIRSYSSGSELPKPFIVDYAVSANGKFLLHLSLSNDGRLLPTNIDYTHPFFEALWNLIAYVEEKHPPFHAPFLRRKYDDFFNRRNPEHDAQVEEILNAFESGDFDPAKFPTVPLYLDVDKDYWDNRMALYKWGIGYEGTFVPQHQSEWKEMEFLKLSWLEKDRIREDGSIDFESADERPPAATYLLCKERLEFETFLGDLVYSLALLLTPEFERISYLGPIRFSPPRNLIALDNQHPSWYAGGSEWDCVRRRSDVRDAVNAWLGSAKLKTPYQLQLRRYMATDRDSDVIEELVLHDKRFDTYVSHKDVGFGISQVLPVLVSAYASERQTIAIEQPEIHLHPALQAELGDVFIEAALGGRKNTFLLETYSEHLILRIMRRMRDTVRGTLPEGMPPVRPEDVAVLYVDRKDDDSTSVVTELALDEEGQLLDPWPGGFFEEGYNERFA